MQHICYSLFSAEGTFNPEIISQLASEVDRLGKKVREIKKRRGDKSNKSRSMSSSSSVYREELEHLRNELDESRHEGMSYTMVYGHNSHTHSPHYLISYFTPPPHFLRSSPPQPILFSFFYSISLLIAPLPHVMAYSSIPPFLSSLLLCSSSSTHQPAL